jgi:hypothetical protein
MGIKRSLADGGVLRGTYCMGTNLDVAAQTLMQAYVFFLDLDDLEIDFQELQEQFDDA